MDYSRGYDGDSSSERSSGHYRDDNSYRKQLSKGRRKSQDGGYRRHSQDSGSDWQRSQSTNGYGKEEDTNGLALVSGFKRLPRQDVLMKPIKSVLVKRKENEGKEQLKWRLPHFCFSLSLSFILLDCTTPFL